MFSLSSLEIFLQFSFIFFHSPTFVRVVVPPIFCHIGCGPYLLTCESYSGRPVGQSSSFANNLTHLAKKFNFVTLRILAGKEKRTWPSIPFVFPSGKLETSTYSTL